MYLPSFAVSIFLLIAFYFTASFVYNKENPDERYDIRNHFTFELWIKKGHKNVFLDFLILASATLFSANYIVFAIYNFSVLNTVNAFLALLVAFSIITIFYLPLSKLKERCIFSIVMMTAVTILNAMQIYEAFVLLKQYENNLLYIPIVVSALIVIIGIITIFYPKLFDFGMNKNEEGAIVRPSFFPLAFFEWLLVFTHLLSQTYIVIVAIVK